MNKYIFHIGRHKSGTSTLQHFLNLNRTNLEPLGFYYPLCDGKSIAHHNIARNFFGPEGLQRFSENEKRNHGEAFKRMTKEIANRSEIVLLSSEGFQKSNPNLLKDSINAESIKIIVYIREQIDYLISAYQQKIHATNYTGSLLEFSRNFKPDYDVFLGRWEKVFGLNNIIVRIYSKNNLEDNDIISDFLFTIGISKKNKFIYPNINKNQSIGGPLLEIKRKLNFLTSQTKTSTQLYRALSILAANNEVFRLRPELPDQSVEDIETSVFASNKRVFARYPSITMGFEKYRKNLNMNIGWNPENLDQVYSILASALYDQSSFSMQELKKIIESSFYTYEKN